MLLKVILILGFILAVTIGAHVVLYKSIVNFFVITNTRVKFGLFACLLFLALSFMSSFFLLRWHENEFSIGYYVFSATWTGAFINFLLAAGVSWLLIGFLRITGHNPNTRSIAASWFILAVFYSTFGVWNALHPRIKTINFQIKNLPDHWKNKTIFQLSDVHLGHIHGQRFLKNVIEKVNAANPEIVFITGDLFDGMISSFMHFAKPLKLLKAPKGVFFITGNHETYVGLTRVLKVLNQTKIKILHNEVIEIDGLQIIGISYPGIKKVSEIHGFEKLKQNPSHKNPRILLFHTPTNICPRGKDELDRHFMTYWVPDTNFELHQHLGVDLQLSGHSHAGQILPFGFLTKLIFKGYDYGLRQESGFYIYTTSGVGTWGPPLRTGNSPEIVALTLN